MKCYLIYNVIAGFNPEVFLMDFMEVIRNRRSSRTFKKTPIPDRIIEEILEAGRLAPSGGNGQNHYFGVIKDEKIKAELAKAAGNQMWITTAPVVIALCTSIEEDIAKVAEDDFGLEVNKSRFGVELISYLNEYPNRRTISKFWENANPLIPGEHIFLAAVNNGLRACWIGYLDTDRASRILNLPNHISCMYLMPIGYAAAEPDEIDRKELEEIVFYEKW